MSYQTKYHKTGQYRNAVKNLQNTLSFSHIDDEGNIVRKPIESSGVLYLGTVKLHGTNANIVLHEDQTITLHSREQYLATITQDNCFELGHDNMGFAQAMFGRIDGIREMFKRLEGQLRDNFVYPVKVSGEWCGSGVQKGVGISFINKKSLFLFDMKTGDDTHHILDAISIPDLKEYNIYNIMEFKCFWVRVDVHNPDKALIELGNHVKSVEDECPVAKALGIKECLVGEGIVWKPLHQSLRNNTGHWFKTKGQKHSTSKVKKLVSADPEKIESIEKFVEYAVTENRLNQGLEHVELDVKNTGKFLGWVNRDIHQEEADVLESNNLEMKDVEKLISNKARTFFMSKL